MTRPEKVSPPPSRSVYTLDDGMIMAKEIWCGRNSTGLSGWKERKLTCMSRFVIITMTKELILGSLNSEFSSSSAPALSKSAACNCLAKLGLGRGLNSTGFSTMGASVLYILNQVLTRLRNERRGPSPRLYVDQRVGSETAGSRDP